MVAGAEGRGGELVARRSDLVAGEEGEVVSWLCGGGDVTWVTGR